MVKNGIGGEPVMTLLDGVKRFDIAVRLDDADKPSLPAIQRIPIRTPSGALVQLSQVAEVSDAEGYSFIRREQLQALCGDPGLDVRGRDIDGFVKDANAVIAQQVKLPTGYGSEWGGAFENQQRALKRLSLIVPATIFFIFVLLYTAFNSVKYAALILANVPFATIGGIVGLAITGQHPSVPSAIGFIAVFGVAMLNDIVPASFLNEQREKGLPVREAATAAPRCACGRRR
ncbi:Metal transporter OS=Rhodanobacter lindaniclasticus OX=75310 GN=B1991_08780 PE=3 SV=1 [Rhodanobacter lindaniclasticus]